MNREKLAREDDPLGCWLQKEDVVWKDVLGIWQRMTGSKGTEKSSILFRINDFHLGGGTFVSSVVWATGWRLPS